MFTGNPSLLHVPHESLSMAAGQSAGLASTGFLGALAFGVTVMLAGFALEFAFGVVAWAFRTARRAAVAVAVTVGIGVLVALTAAALFVSARGH
jgi:hypothetical protein